MSQCKAQHTVGTEVRFCIGEEGYDHPHIDYQGERFTPEEPKAGVEIVDFAEVTIDRSEGG